MDDVDDGDPSPLTAAEASARFNVAWYRFVADLARGLRLSPEHWERRATEVEAHRWWLRRRYFE